MVVKTKGTPQSASKPMGRMTPGKTPKKANEEEMEMDDNVPKSAMKGPKAQLQKQQTPATQKKTGGPKMPNPQSTPGNKMQQTPRSAMKPVAAQDMKTGKTPKQQATPGKKQETPKVKSPGIKPKQVVKEEMSDEELDDEDEDEEFESEEDDEELEDEDEEESGEEDEEEEDEESEGEDEEVANGVSPKTNGAPVQNKRNAQQAGGDMAKRQKMNNGEAAKVEQGSKSKPTKVPKEEIPDESEEDEEDEELGSEESPGEGESLENATPKGKKASAPAKNAASVQAKKEQVLMNIPAVPMKLDEELKQQIAENKSARDRCSLFFKNVPKGSTDEDIKALSSDIVSINRRNKFAKFGWLLFASEDICKKNYEKLKNASIGDSKLVVDLCVNRGNSGIKPIGDREVNGLALFIAKVPESAKVDDMKKLFPTATDVFYNNWKKFAFVHFDSPEKTRQAFEKSKSASIKGVKLNIDFARMPGPKKERKEQPRKKFPMKKKDGKKMAQKGAN